MSYNCPTCNFPMEATVEQAGSGIVCTNCQGEFTPAKIYDDLKQHYPQKTKAGTVPKASAGRVRDKAESFEAVSILVFVLSIVVLAVAGFFVLNGHDADWLFYIGGSFVAAAFWLYLIAQIIHIRANTEK